ncbi:MAG: integrin alpha, partial [Candidatus Methylomirabilis sp.]|nr:integrin alpha [Deltaproteobacteria bacterium]
DDGDRFGTAVAGAGDVNDDGFADVVIGANLHANGAFESHDGKAYVYSGADGSLVYAFTSPGTTNGRYAFAVDGAGDVNNDGFADVIVGGWEDDTGGAEKGRADIYSGADGSILYSFLGEAAGDRFGRSVAGLGDVNGDGFDDVAVGSGEWPTPTSGKAYVYSGQTGALLWSKTDETPGDGLGLAVASAGDWNGDGRPDVLVGAPLRDGPAGADSGKAYVYSGPNGALLDTIDGKAAGDRLGASLAGLGDVDGDGNSDVIVAAPFHDGTAGSDSGKAFVYGAPLAPPPVCGTLVSLGEGPDTRPGAAAGLAVLLAPMLAVFALRRRFR